MHEDLRKWLVGNSLCGEDRYKVYCVLSHWRGVHPTYNLIGAWRQYHGEDTLHLVTEVLELRRETSSMHDGNSKFAARMLGIPKLRRQQEEGALLAIESHFPRPDATMERGYVQDLASGARLSDVQPRRSVRSLPQL